LPFIASSEKNRLVAYPNMAFTPCPIDLFPKGK